MVGDTSWAMSPVVADLVRVMSASSGCSVVSAWVGSDLEFNRASEAASENLLVRRRWILLYSLIESVVVVIGFELSSGAAKVETGANDVGGEG